MTEEDGDAACGGLHSLSFPWGLLVGSSGELSGQLNLMSVRRAGWENGNAGIILSTPSSLETHRAQPRNGVQPQLRQSVRRLPSALDSRETQIIISLLKELIRPNSKAA